MQIKTCHCARLNQQSPEGVNNSVLREKFHAVSDKVKTADVKLELRRTISIIFVQIAIWKSTKIYLQIKSLKFSLKVVTKRYADSRKNHVLGMPNKQINKTRPHKSNILHDLIGLNPSLCSSEQSKDYQSDSQIFPPFQSEFQQQTDSPLIESECC